MQKSTQRVKKVREAYKASGVIRFEVVCKPAHKPLIKAYAKKLREAK
jgi:hypothetical protein